MKFSVGEVCFTKINPNYDIKEMVYASENEIPVEIVHINQSNQQPYICQIQWTEEQWDNFLKWNPERYRRRNVEWHYREEEITKIITRDDLMLAKLGGF